MALDPEDFEAALDRLLVQRDRAEEALSEVDGPIDAASMAIESLLDDAEELRSSIDEANEVLDSAADRVEERRQAQRSTGPPGRLATVVRSASQAIFGASEVADASTQLGLELRSELDEILRNDVGRLEQAFDLVTDEIASIERQMEGPEGLTEVPDVGAAEEAVSKAVERLDGAAEQAEGLAEEAAQESTRVESEIEVVEERIEDLSSTETEQEDEE